MEQHMGMVTGELRSFWKSRVQGIRTVALTLALLAIVACGGGGGSSGGDGGINPPPPPPPATPYLTLYRPATAPTGTVIVTTQEGELTALRFGLKNADAQSHTLTSLSISAAGADLIPGSTARLLQNGNEIATATESGGVLPFPGLSVMFASGWDMEFDVALTLPEAVTWHAGEAMRRLSLSISPEQVTTGDGVTVNGSSVSGRRLYRERGLTALPRNEELFLGNLESGDITLLTTTRQYSERDAIFSSDGTFVVFAAINQDPELGMVNADGTGFTKIPLSNGCNSPFGGLALDPTNSIVVYGGACDRGPGTDPERDILASKLDGTGVANFTDDAFLDYSPVVSGNDIFYVSCLGDFPPPSGPIPCAVYKITVDWDVGFLGVRELVYDGFQIAASNSQQPRWLAISPDGERLLLGPVEQGGSSVKKSIMLDRQGNVLRDMKPIRSPSWDSAGRIFYYQDNTFRVMNADGADDRLLPELFWEDCNPNNLSSLIICPGGISVFVPPVSG